MSIIIAAIIVAAGLVWSAYVLKDQGATEQDRWNAYMLSNGNGGEHKDK